MARTSEAHAKQQQLNSLLQSSLYPQALERAKNDYGWFIANFVHIERKDVTGGIGLFLLWAFQIKALAMMHLTKRLIVLKARQLGLSWLVLAYTLCRMLWTPGFRATAVSKTDAESMEMARRLRVMMENLPPWMVLPHNKENKSKGLPTWEGNTDKVIIHFPRKNNTAVADSMFIALPQSPGSGRSLTGHLLILDEFAFQEHANEIWTGATPTINDGPGQVVVISTGKRGTKFEELCQVATERVGRFQLLFFPWDARPDRDQKWYEGVKADNPNGYRAEYPRTPEEAFSAGQGKFFREWDEDVHVISGWQPPVHWRRQAAFDPGFSSRACIKWYAIHPQGLYAVCYREFYPTRMTDIEQAEAYLRLSIYPDGTPEEIECVWTDREAWNSSGESEVGESTADVFLGRGVPLIQAAKSKLALRNGWRRLHAFLRPEAGNRPDVLEGNGGPPQTFLEGDRNKPVWTRLIFTDTCAHTRRTYPSCVEAKNEPEDISRQSEHHCQDVDRMWCYHYPLEIPGAPTGTFDSDWSPDPHGFPRHDERHIPWQLRDDPEREEW